MYYSRAANSQTQECRTFSLRIHKYRYNTKDGQASDKITSASTLQVARYGPHFAVKCQPFRTDLSHRPGDAQTPEIVVKKQPDKIYTRCENEEPAGGMEL